MGQDQLLKRISTALAEAGLSERKALIKASLGLDFIRDIRRRGHSPKADKLKKLATAVGKPLRYFTDAIGDDAAMDGSPGNAGFASPSDPLPPTNVRPAPDAYLPQRGPRDLQVWGSAEGGPEGAFELLPASFFGYVDLIHRPPGLIGVSNGFALYVVGDSMSPWKEPGETLYINPGKEPQVGSYVVAVLRNDEADDSAPKRAMVKRLVRRSPSVTLLEQFNPARVFEIPTVEIIKLYRVMDQAELLGFR